MSAVTFVTLPGLDIPEETDDHDLMSLPGLGDPDDELMVYLPEHYDCFAHTLQLIVRDAGQISKVIAKVSKFVSHVGHSTITSDKLEGEIKLQVANATRLNRQLMMIKSLLRIKEDILNTIDHLRVPLI